MHDLLIERAIRLAALSEERHKIGCIIVNKKQKIISYGVNSSTKSHPTQAVLARRCNMPHKIYLHAEIAALVRCREEPHTIYIGRQTKNGYGLARPCDICMLAIAESNIVNVVYTTTGNFSIEKIR